MISLWQAVREAGLWGYLEVALFLLGLLPAIASLVLGIASLLHPRLRPWARFLGGAVLLLAGLAFVVGGAGTMQGRKATRRALDSIDAFDARPGGEAAQGILSSQRARILRQGYLEASRSASIGEVVGGVFFLLGATGFLVALGPSPAGTRERGRVFGLVALVLAFLSLAPLAYAASQPIPPANSNSGGTDAYGPDEAAR